MKTPPIVAIALLLTLFDLIGTDARLMKKGAEPFDVTQLVADATAEEQGTLKTKKKEEKQELLDLFEDKSPRPVYLRVSAGEEFGNSAAANDSGSGVEEDNETTSAEDTDDSTDDLEGMNMYWDLYFTETRDTKDFNQLGEEDAEFWLQMIAGRRKLDMSMSMRMLGMSMSM